MARARLSAGFLSPAWTADSVDVVVHEAVTSPASARLLVLGLQGLAGAVARSRESGDTARVARLQELGRGYAATFGLELVTEGYGDAEHSLGLRLTDGSVRWL